MKKYFLLLLIITILILGIIAVFKYKTQTNNTKIYSVDNVERLCSDSSCNSDEVKVRGYLFRASDDFTWFALYTNPEATGNSLSVKLDDSSITQKDKYTLADKLSAEVILSGVLFKHYTIGPETTIEVSSIKDIDFLTFKTSSNTDRRSLSEAYEILISSNIYKTNDYTLSGGTIYGKTDPVGFQASSNEEGGCSTWYYVYPAKISLERRCADANPNGLQSFYKEETIKN